MITNREPPKKQNHAACWGCLKNCDPNLIYALEAMLSSSTISHTQLWQPIICDTQTTTFWAGKDIRSALTQPVSLSSQDEKVGDGSSTTSCQEFGGKKKMSNLLHNSNIYAFKWIQRMRWHDSVKTVLDILHLQINSHHFTFIILSWLSIVLIQKIFCLFVLFCSKLHWGRTSPTDVLPQCVKCLVISLPPLLSMAHIYYIFAALETRLCTTELTSCSS